jgi:hypothetical protein
VNGGTEREPAAIEWTNPRAGVTPTGTAPANPGPPEPTIALGALEELEAERDKWRERAIVWRERALAAELLAKELGAHLADVRASLEDLRAVVRAWVQEPAAGPSSPPPTPWWRRSLTRLVEGPSRARTEEGLPEQP